jgi:very-short-patch-repair endonuclease
MTPQEKLVWKLLRKKKLSGYRFLRQHPIFYREEKNWVDFYIADFYCSKLKLVVEIDGKIHDYRKEYDYERDQKLNEKGIRVVRIKNEETKDKNKLEMNLIDIIAFRASSLATL